MPSIARTAIAHKITRPDAECFCDENLKKIMVISILSAIDPLLGQRAAFTLNDAAMEENPCAVRLVDKS
ncbi:MAG TPA: hypothetical protein VF928_08035 [Usitatibacteraceae bacterium]